MGLRRLFINGKTNALQVFTIARTVIERTPDVPVLVKADQSVNYGRVISGMVLLQRAGARKVGFLTDPAKFDLLEEE